MEVNARTITAAPTRKVLSAGLAGGVGQYLGDIILYIVERVAGDLPDNIDKAIIGLTIFACVVAAGYFTPPAIDEGVRTEVKNG